MSSEGFGNILSNKLADEIRRYYSEAGADTAPDLLPVYTESFLTEFGEARLASIAVQLVLTALAISTAACLHASYRPGESNEALLSRAALARVCAAAQAAKIDRMFPDEDDE
jgi:hypothetical protein